MVSQLSLPDPSVVVGVDPVVIMCCYFLASMVATTDYTAGVMLWGSVAVTVAVFCFQL